ncbi:unnamed protein product [Cutaneotrichosporon oleaginosum]
MPSFRPKPHPPLLLSSKSPRASPIILILTLLPSYTRASLMSQIAPPEIVVEQASLPLRMSRLSRRISSVLALAACAAEPQAMTPDSNQEQGQWRQWHGAKGRGSEATAGHGREQKTADACPKIVG